MNRAMTAIGLASLLWGCDLSSPSAQAREIPTQAATATYTERIKIDDV